MIKLLTRNNKVINTWLDYDNNILVLNPQLDENNDLDKTFINNNLNKSDIIVIDIDIFKDISNKIKIVNNTGLNCIAITEEPKIFEAIYCIKKGFKSYLQKDIPIELFKVIINTVKSGNVWIYPEVMNKIVELLNEENTNYELLSILSKKEQEVALEIKKGKSNKEIAEILDVQQVTIKKHISSIFEKLKVKDRVSLALLLNKKDS